MATSAKPAHVPQDRVIDFDFNSLPTGEDDYFRGWKELHADGVPALIWTPRNGGHWIATRGSIMHDLFADTAHLSSSKGNLVPGLGDLLQLIPVQSDPPEHASYRSAVLKGFSPKHVTAIAPEIRERTRSKLEQLRPRGSCEFVSEFAEELPVAVFLSMLNLPLSDRTMLRDLVTAVHRPDGSHTMVELVGMIHDYLRPYVHARLAEPGEDIMSRILAAGVSGRAWTEPEAARLATNLLVGGLDTVAALLGFTIRFLAENPDHRRRLVEQPQDIPRAADEFTRRFGMTNPVRLVTLPIEVDGVTLLPGDMILLATALHNLDDRCISDPMEVDFDRGNVRHSTMGHGAHFCVGAGLARVEMIIFLEEWLASIPEFWIDPDCSVQWQAGGVGTLLELHLRWNPPSLL